MGETLCCTGLDRKWGQQANGPCLPTWWLLGLGILFATLFYRKFLQLWRGQENGAQYEA